jgi:hypothetical protein
MEDAGISFADNGPLGMAADPDASQLFAVAGGLAAWRLRESRGKSPCRQAIGTDHLVLHLSNLEVSAAYYKTIFGAELPRHQKA